MQKVKNVLRGACASVVLTAAPVGFASPLVSNVVAVTGMADPGGSGTFTSMDYTFSIRGGVIALRASTTGTFPADDGDWRYTGAAGLQQVPAVAVRATELGLKHSVALRGHRLRTPVEARLVTRCWAAMRHHDERQLLGGTTMRKRQVRIDRAAV